MAGRFCRALAAVSLLALIANLTGSPSIRSESATLPPPRARTIPAAAPPVGSEAGHAAVAQPLGNQDEDQDLVRLWAWDFEKLRYYEVEAQRVHVGPKLWVYVEGGQAISGPALLRLVSFFEDRALPTLHAQIGEEASPGIDGESAISLLLMDIRDARYYGSATTRFVTGYFDPANQETQRALDRAGEARRSNEREMVYVDIGFPVDGGGNEILRALAHELTHLILWNLDPFEEPWIEEGLAELSGFLCGLGHPRDAVNLYLQQPERPIMAWNGEPEDLGKVYLFGLYLHDRYTESQPDWLSQLAGSTEQGRAGLERSLPDGATADALFRDFGIALHLAGAAGREPPFGFRSIALGSSTPPDGFRAPAVRYHSAGRRVESTFELGPWQARAERFGMQDRKARFELGLPAGSCFGAALLPLRSSRSQPVDVYCSELAFERRWLLPAPLPEQGRTDLLILVIGPGDSGSRAWLRFEPIAELWTALLPRIDRR